MVEMTRSQRPRETSAPYGNSGSDRFLWCCRCCTVDLCHKFGWRQRIRTVPSPPQTPKNDSLASVAPLHEEGTLQCLILLAQVWWGLLPESLFLSCDTHLHILNHFTYPVHTGHGLFFIHHCRSTLCSVLAYINFKKFLVCLFRLIVSF